MIISDENRLHDVIKVVNKIIKNKTSLVTDLDFILDYDFKEKPTTLKYSKVDFVIFHDETDASEWIAFGCGFNVDYPQCTVDMIHHDLKYRIEKESGLLATSQIHTLYRGAPVNFDRIIPRPIKLLEWTGGAFANNYFMKVRENEH